MPGLRGARKTLHNGGAFTRVGEPWLHRGCTQMRTDKFQPQRTNAYLQRNESALQTGWLSLQRACDFLQDTKGYRRAR